MNDKLPEIISSSVPAKTVEQKGEKNLFINHAEHVTNNITYATPAYAVPSAPINWNALNHEYYNLFVMGGETFSFLLPSYFMSRKDRSLTEYMSTDIKDKVDSLSLEAIEFIKTLPAIFCDENASYGQASDSQIALLGVVTDVFVQDNGIKVYYKTQYQIPQNALNNIIEELSIIGNEKYNELNRTHWCIKRNNLLQSLTDAHLL